uniref:Late embryogenesis abundant protein LEA-2 subgroup domain-containing protein n=1 Tax=Leersia perrieri TaxID=77586 RepID=A0A0D9V9A9_9ORYZ
MAPRDGGGGAGTSASKAGARPDRRIRFATQETESRPGGNQPPPAYAGQGRPPPAVPEQSPVHGDATPARGRPSYVPPWQRRVGEGQTQPHAATAPASGHHRPPVTTPHGAAVTAEERRATPVLPGGARPSSPIFRVSTPRDDDVDDGAAFQHHERPHGPRYVPPRRRPEKKRNPMALCCILFWLLVIAVGVSILVVFLVYHPRSPRLSVTSATLNAANIGKYFDGGDAPALNADLTVAAAISNPNTRISVVLRYVQLDLYFEGSMIATQEAAWPAPPLRVAPRGSVVRSVSLVASNVTVTQEDASVWRNATASGGPVALQLAGRFRTQLVFGRWFRYTYWVTPRCALWLDPPPSGALRRARC